MQAHHPAETQHDVQGPQDNQDQHCANEETKWSSTLHDRMTQSVSKHEIGSGVGGGGREEGGEGEGRGVVEVGWGGVEGGREGGSTICCTLGPFCTDFKNELLTFECFLRKLL